MSSEELKKYLDKQFPTKTDGYWVVSGHHGDFSVTLLEFINHYIEYVIGKDEVPKKGTWASDLPRYKYRNELRREQRNRADL